MYLLLVENSYISSREIKSLLHKNEIQCEIVNCSTSEALLDLAEKISPDLVIIDFDLFVDESADIVTKLRRFSPSAYILAFVDPDHYNRLHRAIDDGIDNYMVKPLQSEDVLLRIKMGLQHKNSPGNISIVDQEVFTEPVEQTPEAPQDAAAESKKMFEDLAEFFGKQLETKTVQPDKLDAVDKEESDTEAEAPRETAESPDFLVDVDVKEEETDTDASNTEETDASVSDLLSRTESVFTWPGTGSVSAGSTTDALETEIAEEQATFEEIDDNTLFGDSSEPENTDSFSVTEPDNNSEAQEYSLIDEAFSLVDNLEDREEIEQASDHTAAANGDKVEPDTVSDLPYFDDLFTQEPLTDIKPKDDHKTETIFPPVDDCELENVFEKEPEMPGEVKSPLDDKELFGMTSKERSVDRSSFEDLFVAFDESARIQKKTLIEPKTKKNKQGKVEYLPFARKSNAVSASVPVDQIELLSQEQPVVPENQKLQATKPKITEQVKQKTQLEEQKRSSSNILRVAGNILTALILIIMVGLSFFLIQSRISGGSPSIAGYQIYVVLSGSMSPAFDTGSIVFVKPAEPTEIAERDIITFSSLSDATRLTTHRVVGINRDNGLSFITRGDANNVNDPSPVPAENVVGRVTGSAPYIGYLFGYAQTRQGLILLFFIPGLFLIIIELRRLFKYMVDAKFEQLNRRTPAGPDFSDSFPNPRESEEKLTLPSSLRDSSLKDFGF